MTDAGAAAPGGRGAGDAGADRDAGAGRDCCGMLTVMLAFGFPPCAVAAQLRRAAHPHDLWGGLFKALCFGAAVAGDRLPRRARHRHRAARGRAGGDGGRGRRHRRHHPAGRRCSRCCSTGSACDRRGGGGRARAALRRAHRVPRRHLRPSRRGEVFAILGGLRLRQVHPAAPADRPAAAQRRQRAGAGPRPGHRAEPRSGGRSACCSSPARCSAR